MKKHYFIFVVVTGILYAPALAEVESLLPPEGWLIGQANPTLVGIEKVYIELRSELSISHVGITTLEDIHKKVQHKLDSAGIKIYPRPFMDANVKPFRVPELRIDIATLKFDDSQKYVFRVQTSLARMVDLPQHRLHIKADVWKTDPIMHAVSVPTMPDNVTNAVLEQVEAFIHAYLAANQPVKPSDTKTSETVSPTTQSQKAEAADKAAAAKYKYVASKNSKVFHKPQCVWAKRIKLENLTAYNSRAEAKKADKRPCKRCKP
ncbi:MAG: Ada metal-binding domain-containing protein [Planctomycetota bacterium]|jgi:hypothetical protein